MTGSYIIFLLSLGAAGPPTLSVPSVVPSAVEQPIDPDEAARALYQEGEAHFRASRYPEAIRSFGKALELVQDQTIHARLMLNIAAAHQREFEFGGNLLQLQKAKSIYERYLMLADGGLAYPAEDIAEVRAQRDRIERKLDKSRKARLNRRSRTEQIVSTSVSEDPAPPAPVTRPVVPTTGSADDERPRWLRTVLLAGGSTATVSGLGMLITGATYRGRAERAVEDVTGGDRNHPLAEEGREFVELAEKRGKVLMGIGTTLAVAGIGGVVLGVLQIKKSEQQTLTFEPVVGPTSAGVMFSGTF